MLMCVITATRISFGIRAAFLRWRRSRLAPLFSIRSPRKPFWGLVEAKHINMVDRHSRERVRFLVVLLLASAPEATAWEPVPKPPLGWNSFDAWDCRIDEATFKRTVDVMADRLRPAGWQYAVIDYIWWHPTPGDWDTPRRYGHPNLQEGDDGRLFPEMMMDGHGRLIPSVERFPSSAGGKGFKPIADYVHSKGLRFGIHIMRGVHRQAADKALPILGGDGATTADIAETHDTCEWCNHMWGVDPTKPGAQAYYDSLFQLYASWEIDLVKADDTMFPPYHAGEIEMIRRAIDRCGRPMVLSLSCGEAPRSRAHHLSANADMWRVSADFWDEWPSLKRNFELLDMWSPFIGRPGWPDADMLPLGRLSLDNRPHGPERLTKFTPAEQRTMMTLWCIARSPLMLGADLLSMPEETWPLLTNPEVLAVNQDSLDNRQQRRDEASAVWVATDQDSGDRYAALFNLSDQEAEVVFDLETEMMRGHYEVRDLWARQNLDPVEGELRARLPTHGAAIFRLHPVE